ncbi:MAG: glutamine--fructose-6-phosphate transaminase (isomerizing) [Desulfurococcales archaeon]|nr:glutamine--fructose-6-phosphate transaminase (isomerizing) [Desulfurococcales archaeon]
MCGIIGITSKKTNVVPEVIDGLKKLEYRGYDSVGLAVNSEGIILIRKGSGDIDSVSRRLNFDELVGPTAIGHTRWATHGPPTDTNAHPHTDCRREIALVHNGVIRNYASLKSYLITRHRIVSDTDTELIAHVLEEELSDRGDFIEALAGALHRLEGSYALAILHSREPRRIYFARMHSPLIVGLGEGTNAVASDIPALLGITRKVILLEDGEFGYIEPDKLVLFRLTPKGYERLPDTIVSSRVKSIEWTPEAASKAGYPHFMIKEIYEQPQALYETFNGLIEDPSLNMAADILLKSNRVIVVGAGTSYHAGLVFTYMLSVKAGLPAIPLIASEFKVYAPSIGKGDVVIAISQSGETYDTLAAIREFKSRGATILALTNVVGSALDREADHTLYIRAGPEIGVAATKTYTSQIMALELLSLRTAERNGRIDRDEAKRLEDKLGIASNITMDAIQASDPIARFLAKDFSPRSMYILGRGLGAALAKEAALKIKEISYIHAEAYPAGESKHGPIALVESDFPVFIIATSDSPEVVGNAIEMAARGAKVRVLKPNDLSLEVPSDENIMVHEMPPSGGEVMLEPFILIPFFQLLSYYIAVTRGYNPDKPRNLAKTVTVE